ncbi:MAG: NAD(P)-dependent glycerol-3-phosphate dehydrogenase [Clostridia bacterium]|nr:NAD(P)-dependent glycerol-3-phosphate dehydrogenase [Clostridia bacterium]
MKIGVLGAGTWGLALASLLAKNGSDVTVWSALPEEIDLLTETRTHKNLPGLTLDEGICYTKDLSVVCDGKELLLFVVPSAFIRSTAAALCPYLQDGIVLASAAKGVERQTLQTMTEIIEDEIGHRRPALVYTVAALSGPTHAEEVALGMPTSIVSACADREIAMRIAGAFSNSCMRVYTNTDVLGVEICGALKNIIALAAGMMRGMGLGDNARAMLITRGISEITRIGLAMGCHEKTFMGLAGIGDLIVTCTSPHSRNNRCGEMIGRGLSYEEASEKIGMVVEGYHALEAAMALSERYGVEMPITAAVYAIIKQNRPPREAMYELMSRDIKNELE